MQDGIIRKRSTIKKLTRGATMGKWARGRSKYAGFGDPAYYLPTEQEAKGFLSSQSYPGFQPNAFDCEDFAFVCKAYVSKFQQLDGNIPSNVGLCIGIGWGRFSWIGSGRIDHACNWILLNTGQFLWYEAQTNSLYSPNKAMNNSMRLLLI